MVITGGLKTGYGGFIKNGVKRSHLLSFWTQEFFLLKLYIYIYKHSSFHPSDSLAISPSTYSLRHQKFYLKYFFYDQILLFMRKYFLWPNTSFHDQILFASCLAYGSATALLKVRDITVSKYTFHLYNYT